VWQGSFSPLSSNMGRMAHVDRMRRDKIWYLAATYMRAVATQHILINVQTLAVRLVLNVLLITAGDVIRVVLRVCHKAGDTITR
jgi:hypothetical protein